MFLRKWLAGVAAAASALGLVAELNAEAISYAKLSFSLECPEAQTNVFGFAGPVVKQPDAVSHISTSPVRSVW